ncbi:SdrD B-like domain-containing protein [Methanococcoides seepicolus]|uniref:Carboxypeptidase regulatory-like domain-containing protein n=1 Tax=Methanococcoides seepicolus TaxID=2828780 RepID=A0A9E5DCY3_9EURY|nr:SdrD B-like domain-containing protein [Methanococcoides seepicolus]MCM1988047.1 carboxypeptidase regulatory-like domain-containing protein [Methanococcoides seepicolus]
MKTKNIIIICFAMALALMTIGTAVAAGDPNVCRELPASANPGDKITVILDLTLVGADKTVIEDNVPAGWVVSNPSDGGFIVGTDTVAWIDLDAPGDNQITYDVTIPGDAAPGTYTFGGQFDLAVAAPGVQPIDCDTQMDIVAAPAIYIGDLVWEDLNGNGIQDAGEPGIAGVTVSLYDCDGNLLDTTTTNATGMYQFTGLAPGDYYVEFVALVEYMFSPQDQGNDDAIDSDADPTTGQTGCTNLESGENDLTWDAGMYMIVPDMIVPELDIDIKPGSFPNSINMKSNGVIAVAILTSADFDALTVDESTVRFGPDEAEQCKRRAAIEDVDGDGDLDLVVHFRVKETGLALGDTEATLTGETYDGVSIEGTDSVRLLHAD